MPVTPLRTERLLLRAWDDSDAEAVLEQLAHSLTNKFLHAPLSALHEAAGGDKDTLRHALGTVSGGHVRDFVGHDTCHLGLGMRPNNQTCVDTDKTTRHGKGVDGSVIVEGGPYCNNER